MPRSPVPAPVAFLLLALFAPATAAAEPGDPDRRFGAGGVVTTAALDGGGAGALDLRGHVLIAGGIERPGVVRLTARGRFDRRFGDGGIARAAARGREPFGVRRARTGTILVATRVGTGPPPIELLRFGARGRALPSRPARDIRVDARLPGVQRPDGGAYIVTSDSRVRAVRPNGLTDWTFGGGAVSVDAFSGRYQYGIGPIALRPDGRLLVTGEWDDRPVLVQLTRRGRLDRRFGARGMVRLPFAAEVVRVLRGGDIVGASVSPRLRAFRLSRTGARRRRFGRRGVARARGVPLACCRSAEDVVDDARGRLYVLAGDHVAALSRAGRPLRRFGAGGAVALTDGRPLVRTPRGDLLIDRRGGLLAIGSIVVSAAPARCTEREDLCPRQPPPEARLAVWRFRL